jgi:hypothetical protein
MFKEIIAVYCKNLTHHYGKYTTWVNVRALNGHEHISQHQPASHQQQAPLSVVTYTSEATVSPKMRHRALHFKVSTCQYRFFNPLNAELNPICHLLALLGGATIVDVSRLRVNPLTPELNPPRNAACQDFLLEILIFKGLTARRLYKSFGVKELKSAKFKYP